MDRLKYIKLENEDGSYSSSIPLAVDSDYVNVNGNTLTNELNNKATIEEVQALASGSPAGVYATVAALTSADPDHSKVYIVSADGHWYYYSNGWQDGGIYQAAEDSNTVIHLESKIDETLKDGVFNFVNQMIWEPKALNPSTGGTSSTPATAKRTIDYYEIPYDYVDIKKKTTGYSFYMCRYNKLNHEFISTETVGQAVTSKRLTLDPDNEVYRFCLNETSQSGPTDVSVLTIEPHKTIYDKIIEMIPDSDTVAELESKVDGIIENGSFNYVNEVEWESGAFNPESGSKTTTPVTAKRTVDYVEIDSRYTKVKISKHAGEELYAFYLLRFNKSNHAFKSTETLNSATLEATYDLYEDEVYKFCYNLLNPTHDSDLSTLTIAPYPTYFDKILTVNSITEDIPIITFIDDDESINFLNNNKVCFDNHNVKCSLAIVTDWVGQSNRMTLEQIKTLKSNGFDILCHSKTHGSIYQNPATESTAALRQDIQDAFDYMYDNDLQTDVFVYPFGSGAGWTTKAKNKIGKIVETVGFNYGLKSAGNSGINEGVINNYQMNRYFLDKSNDISTYTSIIDNCKANKTWLIFGFHSGNTSQIDATYLNSILDYINSQGISIMTFSQALQYKKNILSKGVYGTNTYTYIDKNGKLYY